MGSTFRSLEHGKGLSDGSFYPLADALPDGWRNGFSSTGRRWREVLAEAVESEILPRLLAAHKANDIEAAEPGATHVMTVQAVEAFVDLIVADDMEQVRAVADRMIVMGGGRDALLTDLLAPAARCLGARWERDICDFTTVTLGVFRLDQIMKETESVSAMAIANVGFDRRILLIPAPGEQHNFGLNMVADVFRDGGWSVSTACAVSGREMVQLVAGEWFDMVGISVMTDRALKGLAENIQAARKASCNRKLCIMVGGRAVLGQPERDRPLNADLIAQDPQEALGKANVFLEATVTDRLHQYKTELVDIG